MFFFSQWCYNSKKGGSVVEDKEKIPFSLRLTKSVIDQFKKQVEAEPPLKQGEFFEKMLNVYTGKQLDAKQVPFNINLFCFDQINHRNLTKTIYNGYGFPIYISEVFRYFGMPYYNDYQAMKEEEIQYNPCQATELVFCNYKFVEGFTVANDFWKPFDSSDKKIERFSKDFKIENPEEYVYLSAFRIFKDFNFEEPMIVVNEHMYLVDKETWLKYVSKFNVAERVEILPKDMPFAVSFIHKLKGVSEIDVLKLDREYLSEVDVLNIKNVLNPTVTAKNSNIDEVIGRYSIF